MWTLRLRACLYTFKHSVHSNWVSSLWIFLTCFLGPHLSLNGLLHSRHSDLIGEVSCCLGCWRISCCCCCSLSFCCCEESQLMNNALWGSISKVPSLARFLVFSFEVLGILLQVVWRKKQIFLSGEVGNVAWACQLLNFWLILRNFLKNRLWCSQCLISRTGKPRGVTRGDQGTNFT